MSMMWPPHKVKMASTPSLLRALATRCPPESRCASAGTESMFGVALVNTLMPLPSGSVQVIYVLLDVLREGQRVVAHEALGFLGPPVLQRLDDVHVIDHRAGGSLVFGDRA